jgi:hypothetical protein
MATQRDKEEQVKFLLSNWIGKGVYWEKKNTYGMPVFGCDQAERPDLLVVCPSGDVAIEVKYADSMANVLDGVAQILRYAQDGGRYFIESNTAEIKPTCYILATQFSIKGHLFEFEKKEVPRSVGKDFAAKNGELPLHEFRYTHMALRTLWRFAEYERDVHGWQWNVGIGFLLSSLLNNPKDIAAPLIQAKVNKQQFIRGL